MEFLTGVKEKETLGIEEILKGGYEGKKVKIHGAVHNIRDMGEVAFVILRRREGLLQCVYEEGKTNVSLKDLKEESAVEVSGDPSFSHQQVENEYFSGNEAGFASDFFAQCAGTGKV